MFDLFDEIISATSIAVSNPQKEVVDGFSDRCSRFTRSDGAFNRTVLKTLDWKKDERDCGLSSKGASTTVTFFGLHLALFETEILLRILKEYSDVPTR